MKNIVRDPYFYEDANVLKNLLNIKDAKLLEEAESNITYIKLLDVDKLIENSDFSIDYIKHLHKYIFGDIYEWAGQFRTIPMVKGERVLGGDTIRYSLPDNIENDLIATVGELKSVKWSELSIDETADIKMAVSSVLMSKTFDNGMICASEQRG